MGVSGDVHLLEGAAHALKTVIQASSAPALFAVPKDNE
jgi:hypothetical protein